MMPQRLASDTASTGANYDAMARGPRTTSNAPLELRVTMHAPVPTTALGPSQTLRTFSVAPTLEQSAYEWPSTSRCNGHSAERATNISSSFGGGLVVLALVTGTRLAALTGALGLTTFTTGSPVFLPGPPSGGFGASSTRGCDRRGHRYLATYGSYYTSDALNDVEICSVGRPPARDSAAVLGQQLEAGSLCRLPITGTYHNGNYAHLPPSTPRHRALVFEPPTVVARQIVGTEKRYEDVRLAQPTRDTGVERIARSHVAVEPCRDAITLKGGKVRFELRLSAGICVGIGDKYSHLWLARHRCFRRSLGPFRCRTFQNPEFRSAVSRIAMSSENDTLRRHARIASCAARNRLASAQ